LGAATESGGRLSMNVRRTPVPVCKDLHCQSAASRVFDDKSIFQKVSNAPRDQEEEEMNYSEVRDALDWLIAKGLIYDSGERRNGRIVWKATPGKEVEIARLMKTGDLAAAKSKDVGRP